MHGTNHNAMRLARALSKLVLDLAAEGARSSEAFSTAPVKYTCICVSIAALQKIGVVAWSLCARVRAAKVAYFAVFWHAAVANRRRVAVTCLIRSFRVVRVFRFASDQSVPRPARQTQRSGAKPSVKNAPLLLSVDQGGAGDVIEAGDAAGPTAETDSELIRELSLADGPVLPPGHVPSAHNNEHTDEHDVPQHVGVADSSVWEPSTIHEDQGHPEPNFLPAFASEENKKINRDVQVCYVPC